ncbi:hypothetical protein SLEP1_g43327 [Rubroshorea leprosula]|uniref:Uncharacterized protein n=1 Tax=Rubroshorea leprosula TaxID=152421 RepID=A0AAV5LCM1_9ROSI|nr:hypothetical protein SLEP1_g43327 [Rubroshorea leprosula]
MESLVFRAQTAQRKASEGRWLLVNRRLLVNQRISVNQRLSVDQIKNEAKDYLKHLLGMGVIGPIFAPQYGVLLYGNRQLKYAFTRKMKRFMLKIGKLLNSLIVNLDFEVLRLEDLSDGNHNVIASTTIELREVCEEFDAIGMVNCCSELWSAIQMERVEKCPDILQRLRDEADVLFQHLEVLIQYDEKIVEKEEKEEREEHEKKLFSFAVLAGGICLCIGYLIGHRFGRFSNLI